jgi:hypothetical protein
MPAGCVTPKLVWKDSDMKNVHAKNSGFLMILLLSYSLYNDSLSICLRGNMCSSNVHMSLQIVKPLVSLPMQLAASRQITAMRPLF